MTTPVRIQLSRRRGWRMPANTVRVSRPGVFGNRFPVLHDRAGWWCMLTREDGLLFKSKPAAHRQAVQCYQELLDHSDLLRDAATAELRGRNLACWCALCPDHAGGRPFGTWCDGCTTCHADLLGTFANRPLACEAA